MKISTTQQGNPANRKIDPRFEAALKAIDRQHFINCENGSLVAGQSIPTSEVLKQIFSVLTLPNHPRVLHVGAGLGYPCAVLAKIASKVVGIEKVASLADAAMDKLSQLQLKNVIVLHGEGEEGSAQFSPLTSSWSPRPASRRSRPYSTNWPRAVSWCVLSERNRHC